MSTDSYYGIDPFFDSDYVANDCNKCGREFNYTEYKSDTCSICDDTSEQERESEREEMSKCVECTDIIIKEGEGCAKCSNSLCGSCCEFFQGMTCGDHLVPVKDCGCLL